MKNFRLGTTRGGWGAAVGGHASPTDLTRAHSHQDREGTRLPVPVRGCSSRQREGWGMSTPQGKI